MNTENQTAVKLTRFSHGAGCGCKISPQVLSKILKGSEAGADFSNLLVGNSARDDAAVMAIDDSRAIISTTDFFTPIVDDPYDFGRIAANNAISDIYAMGGKPLMAISILGWPVDKLPAEVANRVVAGGRAVCESIGIPLAGGHSIDTPEPIFGLAVTGIIDRNCVKKNNSATVGSLLFLTKPLGIGLLTTAEKNGLLRDQDKNRALDLMLQINDIGLELAKMKTVTAMTDVTGFGLLGHLTEMCEGSGLAAEIDYTRVPKINNIQYYLALKSAPGGTYRNFSSYGSNIGPLTEDQKILLCDPQTNGGLLVAVEPSGVDEFKKLLQSRDIKAESFGRMTPGQSTLIEVN
jgi:selenide,water dikinase